MTNTENEPDAFITKKGKGVRVYRPFDTRDGRRVPRDYYEFRIARNGRRVKFRLPGNKRDAGPRADEIASFLADTRNTLEQAFELFSPDRVPQKPVEPEKVDPTVGQIIQRFTEQSVELQPSTLAAYTGAIRRIAGFLHKPKPLKRPKTKDHAKWLEAVDSVNFSLFTPEALENFRATMIKQVGSDLQKIESAKISANACMRNAAGLFGRRMLKYYKDFDIPDPIPFREVGMLKERHPRYHSTFDIRDILLKAKEELKDSDLGAYFMVLLAAYAGLRRGEISALTWDQIDFDHSRIWIHTTTEFRPKAANSEYPVDIPEELAIELLEYRSVGIDEHYVLPGSLENRRLRCRQLTKVVTAWLRKQGIQDKKPLHALRKEAGSFIFRKTGSIDKASRFLRNDRRTAERHYVGQTERLVATYD